MKILIISYFFPPYNAMGAVRVGKTAKYLSLLGHDVRVISAKDQPLPSTLPLEIDAELVSYAPQINIDRPVELLIGGKEKVIEKGYSEIKIRNGLAWKLGNVYKKMIHFPDRQIGWYPFAVREASELVRTWQPDVVYASATPYTSLLVADTISRRFSIPWIAELRDLWMDNHYRDLPTFRLFFEGKLEKKTLLSASAFVTVSQSLAAILREKVSKPVEVIYNGFDPEDYPDRPALAKDNVLSIAYTGSLYEGKRDIEPLLEALSKAPHLKSRVKIHLYGYGHSKAVNEAKKFNLEGIVENHGMVSYSESLAAQVNADVLLFVLWNDEREKGVLTGKLFEYMGASRPILAIGAANGEAAQLLKAANSGCVANTAKEITEAIDKWLDEKSNGILSQPMPPIYEDFTRLKQTERLSAFMNSVLINCRAEK